MGKSNEVFGVISNDLVARKLPFMVLSDDILNIITDKATITIKKTGACILKTNVPNAMTVLAQNGFSSTREIWTGKIVSEYSAKNANTIADDIQKL